MSHVRRSILRGEVTQGDRLPTERELSVELGVSRATLREGLRALELEGLIEVRLGNAGGTFVAAPNGQLVGAALDSLMHLRHATRWEIQEYRREFEPQNAVLAARRATETDLKRLDNATNEFLSAVDDGNEAMEIARLDTSIHVLIAEATHNEVRASIMVGLAQATRRALEVPPRTADGAAVLAQAGAEFLALVDAIRRGDATSAEATMSQHLIGI